jgi:hypothetical protein
MRGETAGGAEDENGREDLGPGESSFELLKCGHAEY